MYDALPFHATCAPLREFGLRCLKGQIPTQPAGRMHQSVPISFTGNKLSMPIILAYMTFILLTMEQQTSTAGTHQQCTRIPDVAATFCPVLNVRDGPWRTAVAMAHTDKGLAMERPAGDKFAQHLCITANHSAWECQAGHLQVLAQAASSSPLLCALCTTTEG